MTTHGTRARVSVAAVGLAILLSGCGTSATPGDIMDIPTEPGPEVIGQGTVIQKQDGPVQLCLGPITMIYPPDCGGPDVMGWDWDAVDGAETVHGTTWGTYAVQGTWDGGRLTLTQDPMMLALYDPMVEDDPYVDPANPGATDPARLAEIQEELMRKKEPLVSYADNGYLFVEVIHDDGSLQESIDAEYGANVVVVRSQLRPVP